MESAPTQIAGILQTAPKIGLPQEISAQPHRTPQEKKLASVSSIKNLNLF